MVLTQDLHDDREILSGGPRQPGVQWGGARHLRVAVAVVLALALAAVGGYRFAGVHKSRVTGARDRVTVIAVPGGRPSGAGLADGSIWVTTWDGYVVRVDPRTRSVVARIRVGSRPLAARAGFGSVWVTNGGDGTVTRIDPSDNSVLGTTHVGAVPYELGPAGGGMWVATQSAAVKIDPTSELVVRRVQYPHPASRMTPDTAGVGLAADEHGVWVSTATGTVLRLRPDTGRLVASIRVQGSSHTSPGAVAIRDHLVWVSNFATTGTPGPGAGEPVYGRSAGVVAIDASLNEVVHRVPSAGYPVSAILPTGDALFMVGNDFNTHSGVLIRSDWPHQVLNFVRPVGGNSYDVLAAAGSLWIPSWTEHALYVVRPTV